MDSLAGKAVIITGASTGIGKATARSLVEMGCKVTLAARSMDKLARLADELGPAALAVQADIIQPEDVRRMVDETVAVFGRVDVLLANAGIYIPGKIYEGDPNDWARLVDTNVTGVMRCVHAVLPQMMAQHSGDIIVTSSISGHTDIDWEPVYSASKHAVQSFVHTVRRQLLPFGIRVGSVAPGAVANELWGITEEADITHKVAEHAYLRSEDVAEAIVFMLTRPAHVAIRDIVMLPQAQML